MTQTLDEIAARTQAARIVAAEKAAVAAGFTIFEQRATWVQAAEDGFHGVAAAMAADRQRGRRRRMKNMRRELQRAALVAAGVPGWIQSLVWLGRILGYVLPAPFNVIVPAVLWVVEKMIGEDDGR